MICKYLREENGTSYCGLKDEYITFDIECENCDEPKEELTTDEMCLLNNINEGWF
jgi:hypothetical protein